jgi:hypothetical protein
VEFKTINNGGQLGIELLLEDTEGTRVTRDLMEQLIEGIVKRSVDYFDETGDYPFCYREKQLHSVVCPSIATLTSAFLMEHPLRRKPAGEDDYAGLADYWISYRNYSFVLELKHGYFAYTRPNDPRQNLLAKFNLAMDQLKSIRKDQVEYLGGGDKGLFKIALMAITFFSGAKEEMTSNSNKEEELKSSFNKMLTISGLDKKTNLRALWLLNKRLVIPMEYSSGPEIYPAVAFVGNIPSCISFQ